MSNAVLHMKIFDSGINFKNIGNYSMASELISDKFSKITVNAALDSNVCMFLMFGSDNFYGFPSNSSVDQFYFGYNKDEVEFGDDISFLVETNDGAKRYGFIGFYHPGQSNSISLDNFSIIGVPNTFNLNQTYTYTSNSMYFDDVFTNLRQIEYDLVDNNNGTSLEKNIISTIYRSYFQISSHGETNGPAFIAVNNYLNSGIHFVNENHNAFFSNLSTVAQSMALKILDLKLFVVLIALNKNDVETLPMSTIQSIQLY